MASQVPASEGSIQLCSATEQIGYVVDSSEKISKSDDNAQYAKHDDKQQVLTVLSRS